MPVTENPDTRNKLGVNLQITSPDKFFSEVYLKNIDTLTKTFRSSHQSTIQPFVKCFYFI